MIDLNKIKKYIPIILLISAFIDTNFDLLLSLGLSEVTANWIKLSGLVLTAFLPQITLPKLKLKNNE